MPTIAELGQRVKAKYPGQYDDMDDVVLGRKVKLKYPDDYADFTDDPSAQPTPASPEINPLVRKAVDTLPAIGGGLGGLAGLVGGAPSGPGAVLTTAGGAITGGMIGEYSRQRVLDALGQPALTPDEATKAVALKGAREGAYSLGGTAIGAVVKSGAKGLMTASLKASEGLVKNFPKVVDTVLKEGAAVGEVAENWSRSMPVMKLITRGRGSEVVGAARREAVQATRAALQQARAARVRVTVAEIAEPAIAAEEALLERTLTPAERLAVIQVVRNRAQEMVGSRSLTGAIQIGPRLEASQAHTLKRIAQRLAAEARNARKLGNMTAGNPALDDNIALGTRAALRRRVANYSQTTDRTKELIGAERAVGNAETKALTQRANVSLTGPLRPFGAASPAIALPPEVASRLALMLNGMVPVFGQAPRVLGTALEVSQPTE